MMLFGQRKVAIEMSFLMLTILLCQSVMAVQACCGRNLPRSCRQIRARRPGAKSGLYYISTSLGRLEVYCEMVLHGGGFTFLSRETATGLRQRDLRHLQTQRNHVLLRLQRTDGRQSYTYLTQLPQFRSRPMTVRFNNHRGFPRPINFGRLGRYIYLAIIPTRNARARNQQGFVSNGRRITFRNCDANPNSLFAFFENRREAIPSNYFANNNVFERGGLAVAWRQSAIVVNSLRNLPQRYFYLNELHFGGCGTYTTSDRWRDAIGTAIGLR